MKRYRTLVADPPWPYPEGFNGFGRRRPLPYRSMTVEQIAALPIASLLDVEGYLFCWTTQRYLHEAFHVIAAWGCTYKQILTWCKQPMGSGLGGMFAPTTEFVLIAQRINPGTHGHARRTKPGRVKTTWFPWKRPYDERGKQKHSAKPEGLQDVIEQVCDGPYLELFARTQRLGWDSWGDEALNHVLMPASPSSTRRDS